MKRFLLRISLFGLFMIGVVTVFLVSLKMSVETANFYKLPSDTHSIIVGDSHAETAYNDSIIPNFKNLAESGDIYFYTYLRTKRIIEENPQIETVFIEFNNGQLLPNMDQYIWENEHVVEKYRKYCTEMSSEEHLMMLLHNFKDVINARILRAQKDIDLVLYHPDRNYTDYEWGDYRVLTENGQDRSELLLQLMGKPLDTLTYSVTTINMSELTSELLFYRNNKVDVKLYRENYKPSQTGLQEVDVRAIVHKKPSDLSSKALPDLNIAYLKKLIAFCRSKKVEVKLIRTPFLPIYAGALNEVTFQAILENELKDVPFLDFKDYPLEPNDYADTHHINEKGAIIYSDYIRTFLNSEAANENRFVYKVED